MGIINVLKKEVSNKIAAGEVVERPASVIKELVENSIDAGASVITVEVQNGGVTYMRVTDNGKGMSREDAQISFERHATSKIHSEDDLDAIYTLGFRGEALSSIGAVSNTELYTKRPDDEIGTQVLCSGGEIMQCEDAGTPNGTSFIVKNLFFNTPARMNFLKKDSTEAGYITDIMTRFILSHPEISFKYIIDGKEKYFSAGDSSMMNCIYAVYGKSYAKSVIEVNYQSDIVKITGMIGKGDAARPNRGYQSFFVNHRYIKSGLIIRALEEAYKNQIMIGKYPMAIINLEINPAMIDINVHPTKLEVKFSNDGEIYQAVYHAVKNALYALPNVPKIERADHDNSFVRDSATVGQQVELSPKLPPESKAWTKPNSSAGYSVPKPVKKPEDVTSYAFKNSDDYFKERRSSLANDEANMGGLQRMMSGKLEKTAESVIKNMFGDGSEEKNNDIKANGSQNGFGVQDNKKEQTGSDINGQANEQPFSDNENINSATADAYKSDNVGEADNFKTLDAKADYKNEADAYLKGGDKWGFDREKVRVIGQIFDTYILAEQGDTMIVADQHAAHERLKYEELKAELSERCITSQMLLVPVAVDLTPIEFAAYSENSQSLEKLGFETEIFGANAILVRATPEPLDTEELKSLVIELLSELAEKKQEIISKKTERMLYTIACKAAVKANHKFDNKQLEKLLSEVLALDNINTCPHGRPIIVTMTKKELEKEFKRIV